MCHITPPHFKLIRPDSLELMGILNVIDWLIRQWYFLLGYFHCRGYDLFHYRKYCFLVQFLYEFPMVWILTVKERCSRVHRLSDTRYSVKWRCASSKVRIKCATYRRLTDLSVMGVRVGVANFFLDQSIGIYEMKDYCSEKGISNHLTVRML